MYLYELYCSRDLWKSEWLCGYDGRQSVLESHDQINNNTYYRKRILSSAQIIR